MYVIVFKQIDSIYVILEVQQSNLSSLKRQLTLKLTLNYEKSKLLKKWSSILLKDLFVRIRFVLELVKYYFSLTLSTDILREIRFQFKTVLNPEILN